jgi:hypothetical protein
MRSVHQNLKLFRSCTSIWNRLRSSPIDFFDAFWNWTRRFFFTLGFLALFSAKTLHLYAHLHSLPAHKFLLWGFTFYTQDVAFTFFIRMLTQKFPWRWLDAVGAVLAIPFRYHFSTLPHTLSRS